MSDLINTSFIETNTNLNKHIHKVDYRFKIIYCIAMMSVIASHCEGKGSIELNIQGWFNYCSFHMPLFMFAAGYFFKGKNVNRTLSYLKNKFKRLIAPIYYYNLFYSFYIQFLKKKGFYININPFTFKNIIIEPLNGRGSRNINPSWFSSTLFFVEAYNIIKRKIIFFFNISIHESIYFIIDLFFSYYSVIFSNKGYNQLNRHIYILRFMHLNIYYQLGIIYNKHLEFIIKKIRNDIYFVNIFILKLCFHLYYSNQPCFYYGASQYYNYSPFTVIIISILGILFWVRISEILLPSIGNSFYMNIVADNTFSIMINHIFALDIVKTIFAYISKNTRFCKGFDWKKFYSLDVTYFFIPNNVLQSGIIYFLSCLIIPIIIQKILNKLKYFLIR